MRDQIKIIHDGEKLTGPDLRKVLDSWAGEDTDDNRVVGVNITMCGWMTEKNSDHRPYFEVEAAREEDDLSFSEHSEMVSICGTDDELDNIAKKWAEIAQITIDEVVQNSR